MLKVSNSPSLSSLYRCLFSKRPSVRPRGLSVLTMSEFHDKVVIITGASAGIGRAAAVLFAQKGAHVVLVGRDKERLGSALQACSEANKDGHHLEFVADITNDEHLKEIVDKTIKKFNRINVLVNNAGSSNYAGIMETTPAIYESIMNVNARAPLFLIQHCAPYLEKTKGSIVNVSSIISSYGRNRSVVYGMAKAAVDQLTRAACAEFGPKGIRVNCVNPGLIATDFQTTAGLNKEAVEAVRESFTKRAPAGKVGEAEEIAEVIVFLASRKTYVNGVNLFADGGITETLV